VTISEVRTSTFNPDLSLIGFFFPTRPRKRISVAKIDRFYACPLVKPFSLFLRGEQLLTFAHVLSDNVNGLLRNHSIELH